MNFFLIFTFSYSHSYQLALGIYLKINCLRLICHNHNICIVSIAICYVFYAISLCFLVQGNYSFLKYLFIIFVHSVVPYFCCFFLMYFPFIPLYLLRVRDTNLKQDLYRLCRSDEQFCVSWYS